MVFRRFEKIQKFNLERKQTEDDLNDLLKKRNNNRENCGKNRWEEKTRVET